MITDHVTIDGADLAYAATGPATADPVLLLHGYFGSHMSWRHQIRALSEDYRVIAPDWFGWGDSEVAPNYQYGREVDRIAALADALDWETFSLAGHDYGGFIGLGFAERYPERLRRLAILNSRAHGSFVPVWYAIFQLVVWTAWLPLTRWLLYVAPVRSIHLWATRRERRDGAMSDEALASYTSNLTPATLARIFRDYRLPGRPDLAEGLADIRMPTSVIWGDEDRFLDVAIARELADEMPNARLELLEETGHFVTEERPGAVTDRLRRLLERRGG